MDKGRLDRVVREFGATAVAPEKIYSASADIFAPCALGGILNDQTIPLLSAKLVAGAANNQLLEPGHGDLLQQRGILYAPDRSEEHTSELQSLRHLVCRLLLEKKKNKHNK